MKGSGSWSMESLHGGTLLGVRGTGYDWESGETCYVDGLKLKQRL